MSLAKFKEMLDCKTYGFSLAERQALIDTGRCFQCREEAIPKCTTSAGVSEYFISHLCEPCFDTLMEAIEEQNEQAANSHNGEDDEPAF